MTIWHRLKTYATPPVNRVVRGTTQCSTLPVAISYRGKNRSKDSEASKESKRREACKESKRRDERCTVALTLLTLDCLPCILRSSPLGRQHAAPQLQLSIVVLGLERTNNNSDATTVITSIMPNATVSEVVVCRATN